MFCHQVGPDNHLSKCTRPFTSSLYLTRQGTTEYPSHEEGTPYNLVVRKRGQKKVISKSTKTDKFQDSLEIIYSDVNSKESVIRIARNGSINIISAGYGDNSLAQNVLNKINESSALNLGEYTKVYPTKKKMVIDPENTYKYLIFSQFNLYPKDLRGEYYINLGALNVGLNNYKRNIKKSGIPISILEVPDLDMFYYVNKYFLNLGDKVSKSNKMTNPYINFNLIPSTNENFKISVTIYKRGSVQLRLSYVESKDVSKIENVLDLNILDTVYSFLESLLTRIIVSANKTNLPIIISEQQKVKRGILNMVDGKQPQMCADRSGLRPNPYSFYGECPDKDMYVRPQGKKRGDGKYEPCCYKLKASGIDSKDRYLSIIRNGYPDSINEDVPNPDTKSAVFTPGTKKIEQRRFPGLVNISKNELLKCIEDSGYIKEADVFDNIRGKRDYQKFRDSVIMEYSSLTGTKKLIVQQPVALTSSNFNLLSNTVYIVTPINDESINVLLYFNNLGESFFINSNNDVSESSLPAINDLANTIIEGYMYPYSTEFIFYPIDILYFQNRNISSLGYLETKKESRYNILMYSINIINNNNTGSDQLTIETDSRFDLDIINGSSNYLKNPSFGEISGLLFIPVNGQYSINGINKKLLLWSDSTKESNNVVALNVFHRTGNRWEVKIDSRNIPGILPQENGTIELPVSFVNKYSIEDGDLVLFSINLTTTGTINLKKPLIPINKINEKINDYSDVINILQSIQSPLSKNILSNVTSGGFVILNKYYRHSVDSYGNIELNKPLEVVLV